MDSLPSKFKTFILQLFSLFRLTAIECLVTFIISLPLIVLKLLIFYDKNISFDYLDKKEDKNDNLGQQGTSTSLKNI